jgi:hypothetical protein
VYGRREVREALNAAFLYKCAYCESPYGATQPVDVEHYRPKGAVLTSSGQLLTPGYYWLAATWDNLLPACIDCNRTREQKDADGNVASTGKAMHFPLQDERRRVRRPGSLAYEAPLLLHPYFDHPERHLELGLEGVLRPTGVDGDPAGDARGRATIAVAGLNRERLVHARNGHRLRVEIQLERVADAENNLRRFPGHPAFEGQLARELRELARFREDEAPYLLVTAQLIERYRRSGEGMIKASA